MLSMDGVRMVMLRGWFREGSTGGLADDVVMHCVALSLDLISNLLAP